MARPFRASGQTLSRVLWLVVLTAGCNGWPLSSARTPNLPGNPYAGEQVSKPATPEHMTCAPASAEISARVTNVGGRLIQANRQFGIRPAFMTAGLPDPEILHQGTGLIIVTEPLVKQCQTDGQLAAVLSLEFGKMVAEREAQDGAARRLQDRPMPMNVDRDSGLHIAGSPDHTEVAERIKMYGERPAVIQPAGIPNPEAVARGSLARAGFAETEIEAVREILKAAEASTALHRQYSSQPGR